MVEELLPASVAVVAQVDMNEGIVPGSYGLSNKLHPGVLWGLASFFDVAGCAGAHDIFPD